MKKIFWFALIPYFIISQPVLLQHSIQNDDAIKYVGNTQMINGLAQLELLKREGLRAEDFVLEIGCGALVAGIPIMSFLHRGHYVGIEPNQWLINDTIKVSENRKVVEEKAPRFLANENFDATSVNTEFDYIIAHSIMSHAAYAQLPLFLKNSAKVLKSGGKVIFSLRLTKPNKYGNKGAPTETKDLMWQYPGNSYFDESTVLREAAQFFSRVEQKEFFTQIITLSDPSAFHDWFVLTK